MSEKGVIVKMPLKIICKYCGELMYQATGVFRALGASARSVSSNSSLCVPEIVDKKLKWKCPGCNRTITEKDLETWTLKITPSP